jgi:transglutaminase-like putative cysteine protease
MAQRARLLAPFALAALSVVAALSLGRVVDSGRFVLPVLGAALLPHAIGGLVRRRGWSVWASVAITFVGVGVFVVLALEPSTTTFGIPGADTWHEIDRQLTGGWHLLRTAPAPAPATDGAILLAVLAVWPMATIADWLAFARHATLGAIAPALVFFVWTSTLGTSEWRIVLTVAFCATAGAFLLAQNLAVLDRRRNWLVSHHAARPRWLAPAALLGSGAVVFALLLAPAIPGAGSDPLLDVANPGRDDAAGHSYRPSVAPFIDIGDKLDSVDNVELFTVRAAQPDYWRIAALDQYSGDGGGQWTLSAEGDDSVQVGLPSDDPGGTLVQHFSIGPLGERWLPAAFRPVAIDLPDTLVVRSSDTIVADASDVSHLKYRVASAIPAQAGASFTPGQRATMAQPAPADVEQYTRVPDTSDIEQIREIARRETTNRGATTPYDQARALNDYFRTTDFVYDTSVATDDRGPAILEFLRNRHGFCVQFASAYAVMARTLGIPARVAVGFTPGTRSADGTYHVMSHDAHAWPEIYLNGLGWTHLFDPTPAQSGTAPGGSALPHDTTVGGTPSTPPPVTTTPTPTNPNSGGSSPTAPPGTTPATRTVAPSITASPSDGLGPWLVVAVVLALVALAIAVYVAAVLAVKRRRRARRRDADDPALVVAGAWEEALDRLREADLVADPAHTALEVARTVPVDLGAPTARPLRELARAYSTARYGEGATGADEARDAWTSLDALEDALDDGMSWTRRWRRRLDLSTFGRR